MTEYNLMIGLKALVDDYLPKPGSNRGYAPSVFVDSLTVANQGKSTGILKIQFKILKQ